MTSLSKFGAIAVLALAACSSGEGPGSGGDSTTTSGTGGTGGGSTTLPACEGSGQWPDYSPYVCNLPAPCPEALFFAGGGAVTPGSSYFLDPAAPTCILTKLRDREVAQLSFKAFDAAVEGKYDEVTIFVLDGEQAAANYVNVYVGPNTSSKYRQLLKPPSYFDGCLALTDPDAIYTCMSDWSDGCGGGAVYCPSP
jgi:hypothetical protein